MTSQQLFEAVYEQHASAVKGYAMRRIEDIPSEPRPWLFGIARRVLANERRRVARQGAALGRVEAPSRVGSDPADGPGLADGPLEDALRNLSDGDRDALLLTAWEGLNHREAARALGIREATFTVRLHRAKRRLGRALGRTQQETTSQPRLETP
jgi:RNA polymerase sigma-70 factor (ECF subfamily)